MDEITTAGRAVYKGIVDSLLPLVGEPLTPALIETIREVCASHVREHGFVAGVPENALKNFQR